MYQPSDTILKKYADVLIKFALHGGEGIKPGDVVALNVPEAARPLLTHLYRSVLEANGHPIVNLIPDNLQVDFFDIASEEQRARLPLDYKMSLIETIDHTVTIIAENNKHALDHVDSSLLMEQVMIKKPIKDALFAKEDQGNLTRTLALYGTQSMADEAGLSLEAYWQEIINACFLDHDDPISIWNEVYEQINNTQSKLNALSMEKVHVVGPDVDLRVQLGSNRKWLGGSGRNIPSFELFTSPDRRGTNGWINFSEPLYRYGTKITGIELHFVDGVITQATAHEGQQALLDMIAIENANKVGEFSLTDRRTSRITKFMAETLYDENVGGPHGNTHIAIGSAYKEAYRGDVKHTTKEEFASLGFNDSAVHTDIVSTTPRTVTAYLTDGSEIIIYEDGEFVL